jgi:3D (Asp-Asp-Asp) domain-containing protein
MKINTKITKLSIIIIGILISTATVSYDTYCKKNFNINDIKAEFNSLPTSKEKEAAKQLIVKNDGIKYKEDFIPKTNSFKVMTVRLTVYWAKGGDTDGNSAKKRSSTGYTLKQGESIAVDPKIIPYSKEVIIPNVGLVKAVDTGTDVRNKKASGGKLPVIDVFFEHKRDAIKFADNNPKVVKVAVLN